jgi:hypothetical protein
MPETSHLCTVTVFVWTGSLEILSCDSESLPIVSLSIRISCRHMFLCVSVRCQESSLGCLVMKCWHKMFHHHLIFAGFHFQPRMVSKTFMMEISLDTSDFSATSVPYHMWNVFKAVFRQEYPSNYISVGVYVGGRSVCIDRLRTKGHRERGSGLCCIFNGADSVKLRSIIGRHMRE